MNFKQVTFNLVEMANIVSSKPSHNGQQVTLKSLDSWLKEALDSITALTDRIRFLETENQDKDDIIRDLRNKVENVPPSQTNPATQQYEFWSKLDKTSFKQQCNLITKENSEKISKEKNVIKD